jgi:tetratricopeptide (TPR) repeat protein
LNIPGSRWRIAALASLGVINIHGFLDDAFYGYGGNAIPLLFVPLVLIARSSAIAPAQFPHWITRAFAIVLAAIAVFVVLLPTTHAMFEANLGALAQTRAELSVYHWPEWGIQDDLRRSPQIDLAPAIAQYRTALAIDPANVTADRRLGQIELSRGEYDAARHHLETAYAVAPEQRATRQMLGESYAIAGEFEKAVALWKTIDVSENQLAIRQWWYDHIGERERAARLQTAIVNSSQ